MAVAVLLGVEAALGVEVVRMAVGVVAAVAVVVGVRVRHLDDCLLALVRAILLSSSGYVCVGQLYKKKLKMKERARSR